MRCQIILLDGKQCTLQVNENVVKLEGLYCWKHLQELSEKNNTDTEKTCLCCFEEKQKNELFSCEKNTCSVCEECLIRYFQHNIIYGTLHNNCMFECPDKYNLDILSKILDKTCYSLIKEYVSIQKYQNILEQIKKNDLVKVCGICHTYATFSDDDVIYCDICKKNWCTKCKNSHKKNSLCSYVFSNIYIEKYIDEFLEDLFMTKCAHCNIAYIKEQNLNKEGSCNLICCQKCKGNFCHLCNLKIYPKLNEETEIYYWHFKGSGTSEQKSFCPLYTSEKESMIYNLKFKLKKIEKYNPKDFKIFLHSILSKKCPLTFRVCLYENYSKKFNIPKKNFRYNPLEDTPKDNLIKIYDKFFDNTFLERTLGN